MPAPKSERLLNLLIMLLVQRRPIAKDRIRELLYPDSRPDAFEKMFERDKDELRSLGVPDRGRPARPALRRRGRLPDPARPVRAARRLADAGGGRGRQPRVAGLAAGDDGAGHHRRRPQAQRSGDRRRHDGAGDRPAAADGRRAGLRDAAGRRCCDRTCIEFDYQRPDEAESRCRHLQPWGMVRTSGRWYLVGFDTDRGAERVFRLDRVSGAVRKVGPARAYDVPPDTDLRETIERLAPAPAAEQAVLLVRKGTGHSSGAAPRASTRGRRARTPVRRGTGSSSTARRAGSSTRCSTTGRTSYCWSRRRSGPSSSAGSRRWPDDDVTEHGRTRRPRPGRAPADPGAVPAPPRPGPPRRRRRAARHVARAGAGRPQGALHVRSAGWAARTT